MSGPGDTSEEGLVEASLKGHVMESELRLKGADRSGPTDGVAAADGASPEREAEPLFDLIELLFFAYRDFVGDADRLLESFNFGRAHHRVLHFVTRRPGLTIAELLDILKITKQSLNRVLKELLDKGYVEARAGMTDRRQRQLYPTEAGTKLALDIARLQSQRFRRVFSASRENARADAIAFLLAMIDPAEQDKAAALVASGARFPAPPTKNETLDTSLDEVS
ncbi:MAG: MarR family winged helix-turn-helix transcriptional regulator [Methylovirgula sp.]